MKSIFNYAMSAVYLVTGLFLLIKGWSVLDSLQNKGLGIILILYSIFRMYRIYSSNRESNMDDDENMTVKNKES